MNNRTEPDLIYIVVSKQDILSGNIQPTVDALNALTSTPENALRWHERVAVVFDGYNDTQWEIFEISEARDFVFQLDERFPFWLYFLSKARFELQSIMLCFLPPFLTPEAKARIFPEKLKTLMEERWLPAMTFMAEFSGLTELAFEKMAGSVFEYIEME